MDGVVAAHAHRQFRGPHSRVNPTSFTSPSTLRRIVGLAHPRARERAATRPILLASLALIGACGRISSPPPASDALHPVEGAPTAAPLPIASANPAPMPQQSALPSSRGPAAPAAPSASAAPAAPSACDELESSPQHRELPPDARARSSTSCEAKENLAAFVATRKSCSSDADCTIVPGSCPFGCFIPVAKAAATEVRAKLTALGERLDKAGNRCVYRCMSPPAARCVEHRCRAGSP
jgi:hypothetical protein